MDPDHEWGWLEKNTAQYASSGPSYWAMTFTPTNPFADGLKAWRERKGLSQSEAAAELGLPSKRTLQNWEIARTRPVGIAYTVIMKLISQK